MRGLWVVCVTVGAVLVVGEDADIRCKEENNINSHVPSPTTDQGPGSVKHKRCSFILKSTNMKQSERKELLEKRRIKFLCKFCNKSETRMNKIPMCKKCINNVHEPSFNPVSKSAKENFIGKSAEEKTERIPKWSLTDRLAHLDALSTNQDVQTSVIKLVTSPLTSSNNMLHPLHTPQATKETIRNDKHLNTEWRGGITTDTKILGTYPSKMPITYITKNDNLNTISRDSPFHYSSFHHEEETIPTNEIIRSKRLKDIRNLTHEDFLKILKDALGSKEDLRSAEIRKRGSILTEGEEKLKQAIFVLPHQQGGWSSEENNKEEEDAEYEEYMGRSGKKSTNTIEEESSITSFYKSITENLTTEGSVIISTKNMNVLNETSNNINNQLINEEKEIFESTNQTKINFDNILEQASSKLIEETSQINNKSTTKNILETTTETIVPKHLNINTISPEPTNVTKIETKKPSFIRQAIENLRNKHLMFKNKYHSDITTKFDILYESATEATNSVNLLENKLQNINNADNLLTNPTGNTEHEIKRISTRSTREVTIQEKSPTTEHISTPKDINPDDIKDEFLDEPNFHGIINKVLPTTFTNPNLKTSLMDPNRKDAIFTNHLNMDPYVHANKYKDLAISMKNNARQNINENTNDENIRNNENSDSNDVLTLCNCENDLRCPIHQNIDRNIYLTENKINLPLILKQKEDGTIQLLLDKSICDYCLPSDAEKYVFKRKTADNLSKYPSNIFNILDKHNDQSSTHVNNYLQVPNTQNINEKLKEQFYKYLIDEQLYNLFAALNIPVESSAELHSYMDDLSEKEKTKLKDFLLTSISDNYSIKDGNKVNEDLYNQKQTEFLQSILQKAEPNIVESTTKSNRITLQIKSEEDSQPQPNILKVEDNNILKSFIRDQILKEIKNNNLCPTCNREQCTCSSNDPIYYPKDNYYNEGRIIDKRHYLHPPNGNILTDHDDLIKKKYNIVNNFLSWAKDVVVPDKKH